MLTDGRTDNGRPGNITPVDAYCWQRNLSLCKLYLSVTAGTQSTRAHQQNLKAGYNPHCWRRRTQLAGNRSDSRALAQWNEVINIGTFIPCSAIAVYGEVADIRAVDKLGHEKKIDKLQHLLDRTASKRTLTFHAEDSRWTASATAVFAPGR